MSSLLRMFSRNKKSPPQENMEAEGKGSIPDQNKNYNDPGEVDDKIDDRPVPEEACQRPVRWVKKVDNTSTDEAKKLSYSLVFSIDISGSMVNYKDAYDRDNPRIPNLSRFESVKKDVLAYMKQVTSSDRLVNCDILLFGEKLYEHRNVRTVEQLEKILNSVKQFERATRTDLVLSRANQLFEEYLQAEPDPSSRSSFFNIIFTDGNPNYPGKKDEEVKDMIAELLIAGTDKMTRDEDRVTLFKQYGTQDYDPKSAVSQFLSFLDDNLQEKSAVWFQAKYPDREWNDDDLKNLYDACDVGKSTTTWKLKDPENKMKGVDRDAFWDVNLDDMFEIAICD